MVRYWATGLSRFGDGDKSNFGKAACAAVLALQMMAITRLIVAATA
jgi:hypothetical protein